MFENNSNAKQQQYHFFILPKEQTKTIVATGYECEEWMNERINDIIRFFLFILSIQSSYWRAMLSHIYKHLIEFSTQSLWISQSQSRTRWARKKSSLYKSTVKKCMKKNIICTLGVILFFPSFFIYQARVLRRYAHFYNQFIILRSLFLIL